MIGAEHQQLAARESGVLVQAQGIVVASQDQYETATAFVLTLIKPLEKEIKDTLDPIVKAAHLTHKEAVAQRDRHLKPLTEAKQIVTDKCLAYEDAQRNKEYEESRVRMIAAQTLQDEERLRNAEAAEQDGQGPVVVNAILDEPLPPPVVDSQAPAFTRVKGVTRQPMLRVEVTSIKALVEYVAKNPQCLRFVSADLVALNLAGRSMREQFNVPGCRLVR